MMKKMLIVENHPLLAETTKSLFISMALADEVEVCYSEVQAINILKSGVDWFRVWLDIEMENTHGLSFIREVYEMGFASRSAIITANRNPEWQFEVESMGFLGYLSKAIGVENFKYAVERIVQGSRYFESSRNVRKSNRLTHRQIDIIKLMAQGWSSKEIAKQLGLTPGTVDNHIAAIINVLRAKSRTHAVTIGIEYGYIPPEILTHACTISRAPMS